MKRFIFLSISSIAVFIVALAFPALARADGPCDYEAPTPTPIMWLKADAITSTVSGTLISTWADSSGNGNSVTQADPSYQGTYIVDNHNLPAVYFDGDRYEMPFYLYNDSSYTVLVASRNANDCCIWAEGDTTDNIGIIYFYASYGRWGDSDNNPNIVFDHSAYYHGNALINSFNRNGDLGLFTTDLITETWQAGLNNWTDPNNTRWIGAIQRNIGFEYLNDAEIYEFLVFENALSEQQREDWINYLYRWVNYDDCDGSGGTCSTVDDYHFTEDDGTWLLAASASISDSVLTLIPGDTAAQNLDSLADYTDYDAVVSVSEVLTTVSLLVGLGIDTEVMTITDTGRYTASFTTPVLGGPIGYALSNQSVTGGYVGIDWTCLYRSGEFDECIAPDNGEFDDSSGWNYYNNAAWNEAIRAAFIPFNDVAAYSNPFYTPAYMTVQQPFTLPTLNPGEYLLISYESQAMGNENGLLTNWLQNSGLDIDYELTFEVFPQEYLFEFDIGNLAGEQAIMLFGNDGGFPPSGDWDQDVSLDNVCIFISDRPPNMPVPVDPNAINPVKLGNWYSCADIAGILANWGIDIRYHRINYQNTPSIWDPSGWVPWLISAFWVMVETYICIFFVAVKTIINLIERIINEILNYASWLRRSIEDGTLWTTDWLALFRTSFSNFVAFLRGTGSDWLFWLALTIIEFALVPGSFIANLFTLALWVAAGFWWLGGLFIPILLWLLVGGENLLKGIFNFLIDYGWNPFLAAIGFVISAALDVLIWIWNNGLIPFLSSALLLFFNPLLFVIFNLFPLIWDFLWSVAMYVWVNVFQAINIPFAFYTGLNQGVQSSAFSDLMACDGSVSNFWCGLFGGLDLVNGIAGHSIFYPIIIVGIIIGTIVILYQNVVALWNFFAQFISEI